MYKQQLMGRLRDVSSETEKEYKNKLADVEKELSSQEGILGEHPSVIISCRTDLRSISDGGSEACEC